MKYKYIQGLGYVKKADYYLYQFSIYFFIFIFLLSSFCLTIIISLALYEILEDYLVNSAISFAFGLSLINILGFSMICVKEFLEEWINEVNENLKKKYKK